MNTYNRAQGMNNRLNMLFNQELDNEAQYIKSHPFSSINMSLGGEVRYIAPIWPWNAPRFEAIDWRTQPPPSRIPGLTKHAPGKLFKLPTNWADSTDKAWTEDQKPTVVFPYAQRESTAGSFEPRDHGGGSSGGRWPDDAGGGGGGGGPGGYYPSGEAAAAAEAAERRRTGRMSTGASSSRRSTASRDSRLTAGGGGGSAAGSRPDTQASGGAAGGGGGGGGGVGHERQTPGTAGAGGGGVRPPPLALPGAEPLRVDVPVSLLPGRPRPETGAVGPRGLRSNASARTASRAVLAGT